MTIVILGGGIRREGILPAKVKETLKKACEISKKYKNPTFLVCGKYSFLYPKDKLPKTTESKAMKEYLASYCKIPKSKIYIENKSKDTIGNAYYAKKNFFMPRGIKKAVLIARDYHLPKIKYIFKKVFGKEYKFKYIKVPTSFKNKKNTWKNERR